MARLNVYVPDELAAAARKAGLNVSRLTQEAISAALDDRGRATTEWLAGLPVFEGPGPSHEQVLRALDEARAEIGDDLPWEDASRG